MSSQPRQIAPGLWRWTAPHPEWPAKVSPDSPSYWPQQVGSVLYATDQSAVFIDPQLPPDTKGFWTWADQRVQERSVHVLTTIHWHRRSRDQVAARYGASTSRAKPRLPHGVESFMLRRAGETLFWLPESRALVPGDRILGAAKGGLRLCPGSWLDGDMTPAQLKQLLQPLQQLPIEHVLVSHGEPVIGNGARALADALR